MMFSLVACGDESSSDVSTNQNGTTTNNSTNQNALPGTVDGFLFKNLTVMELGTPDKALDPQSIYDNLTYTPQMFYGDYTLFGGDSAEETFEVTEYIHVNNIMAYILPLSCFETKEQYESFLDFMKTKCANIDVY